MTPPTATQRVLGVAVRWIDVQEAVLCLNCQVFYPFPERVCPRCGSEHSYPVARWLSER